MTKKSKKNRIAHIFLYLFWFFIFLVGVVDLFFVYYRSIIWFGSLAILILIYKKFKKIPLYINLILAISAIALIFGEVMTSFFYNYAHYDKFLHFLNPIIIALLVYHAYKDKIRDKNILLLFCVFASISVMTSWEIFEFLFDRIFNTYLQGVYIFSNGDAFGISARQTMDIFLDTIFDLIWGFIGLILFTIGYKIKLK